MDCPRVGKLFGGCKFSPRYDLGAPDVPSVKGTGDVLRVLEICKPKTYVRDVCERCGKTIERSQGRGGGNTAPVAA